MGPVSIKQSVKVYRTNEIKAAILNNEPIEEFLHVIMVISNPIGFERRYKLGVEFRDRMMQEKNVKLYIVEVAYGDQQFRVTDGNNKNHLRIRTNSPPLWIKENMINIGVERLLPVGWKAMAWVDADIEFEDPYWALNTLKILNGCKDIIQLWSHCVNMNPEELALNVPSSSGYHYEKGEDYHSAPNISFWHPGYSWACTRKAYYQMNGVYEDAILGSGDTVMQFAFIGNALKGINEKCHDGYKESVLEFQDRCGSLRFGYCPGVIRHYYHGSMINRGYSERWKILVEHKYNPKEHITRGKDGLIVPTDRCPKELLDDIYKYFESRLEDDI